MEDKADVLGFLRSDGVLHCSSACACQRGKTLAYEIGADDYEGLVESETLAAASVCPKCGSEFAVSWPERGQN